MPKLNVSIFNSKPITSTASFWNELIGDPVSFTLESRIFHSISIGLIILAGLYVPYNLYAGLYVGSASALIIGLFYGYQYYRSRVKGKRHNSAAFGIIGLVIFGVNYFTNSGINGSTDLIWPAHLLLVLAISPYHQHLRWVVVYLVSFLIIHAIEFYYPSMVQYPFVAGKGQFIDRITAFPLPVIAIYIVIKFIRKSYDNEKKAAEEKTIAVEASKQQILVQKDQLEQSNIEKNKLMSIISHDLRTPLMNVQNYLELLNAQPVDSEDRAALEKALLNSTNSAMNMLGNLLSWSKSQMEGLKVRLLEVNLAEVLQSTLEMESVHASKKEIRLEVNIPADLCVVADVDMLQLVVRNLISNAIKFTPSGGRITVEALVTDNECRLFVNDTGNGIPAEKQAEVFSVKTEPTYGTNNEKGVGLGLVLCKEFIERQGGRISFKSKVGEGSKFTIAIKTAQRTDESLVNL